MLWKKTVLFQASITLTLIHIFLDQMSDTKFPSLIIKFKINRHSSTLSKMLSSRSSK